MNATQVGVVDGMRPGSEHTIVRNLLTNAAIGESVVAGYAATSVMYIVVERRLKRQFMKDMVEVVVEALKTCTECAHVVIVVRADHQEACVCTLHGMRWEGDDDPPKVVMKLIDVPTGEPREHRQRSSEPTPHTRNKPRVAEDDVDRATVVLLVWVMLGGVTCLCYAILLTVYHLTRSV